uniref:Ecdysteroid UDP-glucosyltransferase n=1 Tax=Erinnyis ello granulovirus TaxID=307444 RepID=A0A288WIF4_9BBAC|nr:ecdysteroid UDP-glucosyltransferase [Erinnyis ello granulovirus]
MYWYCVTVFVVIMSPIQAANILCVFPTPAVSHQMVFAAYVDKLAASGHNVTVVTPVSRGVQHIIEIECRTCADVFDELVNKSVTIKEGGMVADESTVTVENYTPLVDMIAQQFTNENVTTLLSNKNNYYDLVVVEAYMGLNLVYGHFYDAPIIMFSSGYATNDNLHTMNRFVKYDHNVYPNMWRSSFSSDAKLITSIEERLDREWTKLEYVQDDRLKKVFGEDTPSIATLKKSVKMLFINVPHIFDNNRPVGENVQYLGGVHLKTPRPVYDRLLNHFLNQHDIVVYVSFGSTSNPNNMVNELLDRFVRVFRRIPYGVVWKIDTNHTLNLPRNVITRRWLPQRDILHHRNVRLFISQCGVQSVDEAIDSVVPVICIPLSGDQFNHANRVGQFGVGVTLDLLTLQEHTLMDTVKSMVKNTTYIDNMYRLNRYIYDTHVLLTPLNKAVTYTNKLLVSKYVFDFGAPLTT